MLADAERLQEVFEQRLTGMDVFQAFHGGSKEVIGRQGEMGRELADMSGGELARPVDDLASHAGFQFQ